MPTLIQVDGDQRASSNPSSPLLPPLPLLDSSDLQHESSRITRWTAGVKNLFWLSKFVLTTLGISCVFTCLSNTGPSNLPSWDLFVWTEKKCNVWNTIFPSLVWLTAVIPRSCWAEWMIASLVTGSARCNRGKGYYALNVHQDQQLIHDETGRDTDSRGALSSHNLIVSSVCLESLVYEIYLKGIVHPIFHPPCSPLCWPRPWWYFVIHMTLMEFHRQKEFHPLQIQWKSLAAMYVTTR